MKFALIFGVNGQDGYYLTQLLNSKGIEVIGVSRKNAFCIGDIKDFSFVSKQIKAYKPEFIFHFAANSTTHHDALFENHDTISTGTINILEAVRKYSPASKVFLSGSGLQFHNTGDPIDESSIFEAKDPYSVARIQSVYMGRYFRNFGLNIYIGYFFHHDSPLRSERHLNMKIAKAASRIKSGSNEIIEIGNLKVIKEYNYALDFMKALWLFVNQEHIFELVIGCGAGYSIQDWINVCFEKIGIDPTGHVLLKESYTPEFNCLVSSPKKLFSLGWQPEVDIYRLAEKMMDMEK